VNQHEATTLGRPTTESTTPAREQVRQDTVVAAILRSSMEPNSRRVLDLEIEGGGE
jgi:hypothetical protein